MLIWPDADYAGWTDKISGEAFLEHNGLYKIVRHEPLGVCAGIASWNATFMYIGWKIAPAIAAGNAVPHPKLPSPVISINRPGTNAYAVHLQTLREIPLRSPRAWRSLR